MNKDQFTKGMTFLALAYNKEFTQDHITVWYDFFKDTDYDTFRQAVKRIIPQKHFLPSIAELKQEIALISNPILQLNADSEWDCVIQAVRRYGMYREEEALNSLKPYTRHIARQVGFNRICMSESIQWERKEFIELFNLNKERDNVALMLSEPQMTLSELARIGKIKEEERLLLEESVV